MLGFRGLGVWGRSGFRESRIVQIRVEVFRV